MKTSTGLFLSSVLFAFSCASVVVEDEPLDASPDAGPPPVEDRVSVVVEVVGEGDGSVTVDVEGDTEICEQTCTLSAPYGSAIRIEATEADGSTFRGWEGACAGDSAECLLTAADGATVTARFSPAGKVLHSASLVEGGTVLSIASHPSGDWLVSGTYTNVATMPGAELPKPIRPSEGWRAGFVARLSQSLAVKWVTPIFPAGPGLQVVPWQVGTDGDGTVVVACHSEGEGLVVSKLDAETGDVSWRFVADYVSDDAHVIPQGLYVSSEQIRVDGEMRGTVSFGSSDLDAPPMRPVEAVFSPIGGLLSAVVDSSLDQRDLDPLTGETIDVDEEDNAVSITRVSPDGMPMWTRRFVSTAAVYARTFARDSFGRVHLVLSHRQEAIVEDLGATVPAGESPGFSLVQLGEDGSLISAQRVETEASPPFWHRLRADGGRLVVSGSYLHWLTNSIAGEPLPEFGQMDAVISSVRADDGALRWVIAFGSGKYDAINDSDTSPTGDIAVVGEVYEPAEIAPGHAIGADNTGSGFVAVLSP